ncbi:seryl-tRNA synthetase [Rhodotorula sp. JG-1b]|nr:seryl-tRNA synthetase [Rhodotorula sp. JG-1b]
MLPGNLLGRIRLCSRCLPTPSKRFASSSPRPASIPHPVLGLSAVLNAPEAVKTNLRQRKYPLDPNQVDALRQMELEAAQLRKDLQAARERRNAVSLAPKDDVEARKAASEVKKLIKQIEPKLSALTKDIQSIALQLPNMSHPDVPVGDETSARLVRRLGSTPKAAAAEDAPTAEPERDHLALSSASNLAWTDFPASSITTGSSWPLLLNEGALLEMALTNYAMSVALSHGFTPTLTPDVVRSDVSERCGFRPRDGEAQQTYFLSDGGSTSALCLAGTAEIPLVAMSAGQTFRADQLPLKHVALGRAFRAEAGARGADSRGLYRVHQFSKVEMVILCAEEQSDAILEELRAVQEEILGALGLSLRVLDMPTEELGASAHRKYDIEAWMPGRGKWGELSSASNCTDFQSRRLGIRYRPSHAPSSGEASADASTSAAAVRSSGPKLAFVHTLNGTAAAIPRLIVALLENGAVIDSQSGRVDRVRLPACLKPFWLGRGTDTRIEWVPTGESLRLP